MERYRIGPDAAVLCAPSSVVVCLPVFVPEAPCRIITDSLSFCHERKGLCVNAYVIMPTHIHAIVFHRNFDANELQKAQTDFRKFTGRSLCDYCETHMPRCFAETFRAASAEDRERRFWQSSRHPEAIETEHFWRQKFDYLHENPCRKGLVIHAADWRFSSAAYYVSDGMAPCDIKLS